MKHYLTILVLTLLCVAIYSCGTENCVCPQPSKPVQTMIIRDTFDFSLRDGLNGKDQCGLFLYATLIRNRNVYARYKPVEIPAFIMSTWNFSDYVGILEILPEEIVCFDGSLEWKEGVVPRPDTMHYCRIIDYQVKK